MKTDYSELGRSRLRNIDTQNIRKNINNISEKSSNTKQITELKHMYLRPERRLRWIKALFFFCFFFFFFRGPGFDYHYNKAVHSHLLFQSQGI
jgi:hypothetical protein